MTVTDAQLRSWRGSGKRYQVIAATIAKWATGKERGTALPDDDEIGRHLDFVASPHTYWRAQGFLVTQGVLAHASAYQGALSTSTREGPSPPRWSGPTAAP